MKGIERNRGSIQPSISSIYSRKICTCFGSEILERTPVGLSEFGSMEPALWEILTWTRWLRRSKTMWSTSSITMTARLAPDLSSEFNTKIKVLKRMAYGYRSEEYFKLKILRRCGYLKFQNPSLIEH